MYLRIEGRAGVVVVTVDGVMVGRRMTLGPVCSTYSCVQLRCGRVTDIVQYLAAPTLETAPSIYLASLAVPTSALSAPMSARRLVAIEVVSDTI